MSDEEVSVNEQEEAIDQSVEEELTDEQDLQAKLKEAIEVTVEDLGSLRTKLTITVPTDVIEEQMSKQYDDLRQDAQVPGFRKGHAPQKLLEKRFGSEVGDQVRANLVSNSYFAAVDKEAIDPLGDPLILVTATEEIADNRGRGSSREIEKLMPVEKALEFIKLPEEGSLTYTCEVEVKPTVELPSLEKIKVEKPTLTITDKEIDSEIKRIMMLRSSYKPVDGGTVQDDDILVGQTTVTVDNDVIKTEENAQLAARDQRYDGMPLDGFGKAAAGKKVGESVVCEFTIPEDDAKVELRGKRALFEILLSEIKRLEVPAIDDEYLSTIGFESEDEFRSFIKERMEQQMEHEAKRVMFAQIEKHLLDSVELELPTGISQQQTERIVSRQMMELYSRGVAESEISKHTDEMRTRAVEQAKDELKSFFVMEKIAEEKEISVSEEELNAAIADIAQQRNKRFDRVRDEIISTNHLNTLYVRLRDQKILEMLLADADVTEKDVNSKSKTEEE